MKKYKLLKDLPTFKAGEIFELRVFLGRTANGRTDIS